MLSALWELKVAHARVEVLILEGLGRILSSVQAWNNLAHASSALLCLASTTEAVRYKSSYARIVTGLSR